MGLFWVKKSRIGLKMAILIGCLITLRQSTQKIYKFENYDRADLLYDASKKASLEDYQLKPYAKKQLQNVEKELRKSSN